MLAMNTQTSTIKVTPKDFFIHLAVTVVLYTAIGALINLLFSIIDYSFSDVLGGYFPVSNLAWPISMLVVLVPIFYILVWIIKREEIINPEKNNLWIKRWRVFLTLFLSGGVIAGDLIVLLNTYLSGEISSRFVYKFIAVLLIFGIVFTYYILDRLNKLSKLRSILLYSGIVIVLGSIIFGFVLVGSPSKQRTIRLDTERVYALQNIQSQVVYYWQSKQRLPANLDDLKDPISGYVAPVDPENNSAYEYTSNGNRSFQLCATFVLKTEEIVGNSSIQSSYPEIGNDNWKHGSGRVCFTRTIDPEIYPPFVKTR